MNYYRQSPFANLTPVVKNLIIINVLFFIATWVLEHYGIDLTSLFSAFYFDSPLFKPWQIITYMFMHAGFWHIFMNMFVLFMFGPTLEYTLGSKRFLNYYFITGIGALAMQMLVQTIEVYHITGSFTIANHDLSLFLSPSIPIVRKARRYLPWCYFRGVGCYIWCFGRFCRSFSECRTAYLRGNTH